MQLPRIPDHMRVDRPLRQNSNSKVSPGRDTFVWNAVLMLFEPKPHALLRYIPATNSFTATIAEGRLCTCKNIPSLRVVLLSLIASAPLVEACRHAPLCCIEKSPLLIPSVAVYFRLRSSPLTPIKMQGGMPTLFFRDFAYVGHVSLLCFSDKIYDMLRQTRTHAGLLIAVSRAHLWRISLSLTLSLPPSFSERGTGVPCMYVYIWRQAYRLLYLQLTRADGCMRTGQHIVLLYREVILRSTYIRIPLLKSLAVSVRLL